MRKQPRHLQSGTNLTPQKENVEEEKPPTLHYQTPCSWNTFILDCVDSLLGSRCGFIQMDYGAARGVARLIF